MPFEVFPVEASPYTEAPKFQMGEGVRTTHDVASEIARIYDDVRKRHGAVVGSHVLQANRDATAQSVDTLYIVADIPTPEEMQQRAEIRDLDSGSHG